MFVLMGLGMVYLFFESVLAVCTGLLALASLVFGAALLWAAHHLDHVVRSRRDPDEVDADGAGDV